MCVLLPQPRKKNICYLLWSLTVHTVQLKWWLRRAHGTHALQLGGTVDGCGAFIPFGYLHFQASRFMMSSPGVDPPPPAPWRKRAILGVGDLVMFEPLQWWNNNYGDDDRENAIYRDWVLLFMTIFTLLKPLCIPCRCVPCWGVCFQLRLWREGTPATVLMALSRAMALSCQLAGCQAQ